MFNSNCFSIPIFLVVYLVSSLSTVSSQLTYNNHQQGRQVIYHPQPVSHLVQPQSQPRSQSQLQLQPQTQHQLQPRLQHQSQPQESPKLRSQQPQGPQPPYAPSYVPTEPTRYSYVTGHRKIINLPDNKVVYRHFYNSDENNHFEERSWTKPKGLVQPVVERALSESHLAPIPNQLPTRDVSYRALSPFEPSLPTNSYSYQPNQQLAYSRSVEQQRPEQYNRRRVDNSNEYSTPIISTTTSPVPSSWLNNNVESLVSYIKSKTFLDQVKLLGSPRLFERAIVNNTNIDEKITRSNINETKLNFHLDHDDCKPVMTRIKFGNINQPEVIYNPSSVELLRCPQACFSWQFDCLPTAKASHKFEVAVYTTTNGEKPKRKIVSYAIESHVACECTCQSLASCFGNANFSPQRIKPTR